MIGYDDVLARAVPARTLWLVVAPLIAAALVHAVAAAVRRWRRASREDVETTRLVGAASLGLTTGAYVGHAIVLVRRGALVEPLAGGLRLGRLEIGFTLCFDIETAALGGAALLAALAVGARLAGRRPEERTWTAWARIELGLAGVLLSTLADNVPTMALGCTLAAAGSAWRVLSAQPAEAARIAARAALAIVSLVVGGVVLFSSAEGGEAPGDDGMVRPAESIALVPLGATGTDSSALRMVSWPGAAVFLDDTRLPIATSPFAAAALPAGHHELRIRPDPRGALPEEVRLSIPPSTEGRVLAIEPRGPTMSFRDLALSLAGDDAFRRSLAEKGGGFGPWVDAADAASLAFWSWLMAACALATIVPRTRTLEAGIAGLAVLARGASLAPLATIGTWAAGLVIVLVFAVVDDRRVPEDALERVVAMAGRLLERFERWVIHATGAAAGAAAWALGWAAAWYDANAFRRRTR
jgi:hypothetical protein